MTAPVISYFMRLTYVYTLSNSHICHLFTAYRISSHMWHKHHTGMTQVHITHDLVSLKLCCHRWYHPPLCKLASTHRHHSYHTFEYTPSVRNLVSGPLSL